MERIRCLHAFGDALRIYRVLGEIGAEELIRGALQPVERLREGLVLLDFSRGALGYAPDEAGSLARQEARAEDRAGWPVKAALLAPGEIDYGLFRILRVCSPHLHYPGQLRSFRQIQAAMRWLGACRLCIPEPEPSEHELLACTASCLRRRP